jgi:hypothetical protein
MPDGKPPNKMAFDWLSTLDNYSVPYSTRGKNVSKGNFVVHCPFCGSDDHGQHMSVALKGRGWRCFRRPDHRGNHPARLLAALIHCSLDQAARLVGDAVYVPEDFMGAVTAALSPAATTPAKPLSMPEEFRAIEYGSPSRRPAVSYLEGRGFTRSQVERMTQRYGLRYAVRGSYKGRIIFPVRKGPDLCSWTGRHVGESTLRYKSLSPDPEKAADEGYDPAMGPISDYLLFHNLLLKSDADTLYLCEGPFDALKVCVLGRSRGAIATCCFTAAPSASQINELHGLFPRFKRRVLLLDAGTLPTTLRVASLFAGMGLDIGHLPPAVKDPGDLTQELFDDINEAA